MRARKERLWQWLDRVSLAVERRSGGRASLLCATWMAYRHDDGPTLARSIAYYALFSFFPLLLVLFALGSSALASSQAQEAVVRVAEQYLATASDLVQANVEQVLQQRGTVGVLATVGLLWSASGVFTAVYQAVNRAWAQEASGSIWRHRLYAVAMALSLGLVFVGMIAFSVTVSFVRGWRVPVFGWQLFADPALGRLLGWGAALLPALVSVLAFSLIYRIVPRAPVAWRDVWPAGVVAGLVWEGAKQLFTWYVGNFARYNLVYGSVGAVIAFLLWSYFSAIILLLGAEFTAQVHHWRLAGRPVQELPLRLWCREWRR